MYSLLVPSSNITAASGTDMVRSVGIHIGKQVSSRVELFASGVACLSHKLALNFGATLIAPVRFTRTCDRAYLLSQMRLGLSSLLLPEPN
jgi:hypothetical protein